MMEMITNRTFTMIKPDAVANGHIGAILNDIVKDGFKIVAMMGEDKVGVFY
jgi:nucleoside-diphosphate kinase